MIAQEGMGRVYEQDLVHEARYLARRPIRISGASGAFLEDGKLLCGLAVTHCGFCPVEDLLSS